MQTQISQTTQNKRNSSMKHVRIIYASMFYFVLEGYTVTIACQKRKNKLADSMNRYRIIQIQTQTGDVLFNESNNYLVENSELVFEPNEMRLKPSSVATFTKTKQRTTFNDKVVNNIFTYFLAFCGYNTLDHSTEGKKKTKNGNLLNRKKVTHMITRLDKPGKTLMTEKDCEEYLNDLGNRVCQKLSPFLSRESNHYDYIVIGPKDITGNEYVNKVIFSSEQFINAIDNDLDLIPNVEVTFNGKIVSDVPQPKTPKSNPMDAMYKKELFDPNMQLMTQMNELEGNPMNQQNPQMRQINQNQSFSNAIVNTPTGTLPINGLNSQQFIVLNPPLFVSQMQQMGFTVIQTPNAYTTPIENIPMYYPVPPQQPVGLYNQPPQMSLNVTPVSYPMNAPYNCLTPSQNLNLTPVYPNALNIMSDGNERYEMDNLDEGDDDDENIV